MNGHERQEPMVFMMFMDVHGCSWAFMGLHGDRGFTDVQHREQLYVGVPDTEEP